MPWNWFQDKDSSFFAGTERRRLQNRNRGSAIRNRDRCSAPSVRIPCPGAGRMQPPPTGQGAMRRQPRSDAPPRPGGRPPLPRAERAAQAETGIGVVFPGIGLGGGAARCATFVSDGTEHRRCGRSTRNFCTHHTTLRPTGIRGRPPRGGAPLHRPTNARKKTNSHECKTPYANRPAGGCGNASARARSSCPAKHNTDNHG